MKAVEDKGEKKKDGVIRRASKILLIQVSLILSETWNFLLPGFVRIVQSGFCHPPSFPLILALRILQQFFFWTDVSGVQECYLQRGGIG